MWAPALNRPLHKAKEEEGAEEKPPGHSCGRRAWKEEGEQGRKTPQCLPCPKLKRDSFSPPSPKLWGSLVACPENGFGEHFSLSSFRTFGVSFHECVHFTTKGGGALGAKFPDEPMQQRPSSPINAFFVVGLFQDENVPAK